MEKFTITIPCKPYVKRFVDLTFGNPAEISKDKELYQFFRAKLQKKSFKYDRRYASFHKYTNEFTVKISVDDFYRHGWDFSATDIISINMMLERKTKALLYRVVGFYSAFGYSLTESIAYFQKEYAFTEAIWPFESIYKDCQRNLAIQRTEVLELLTKIIKRVD